MMMKKYASLLFALVLALSLSVSAAADADVYVYDDADILSTDNAPRSPRRRWRSPTSTAAACTS